MSVPDKSFPEDGVTKRLREHTDALGTYHTEVMEVDLLESAPTFLAQSLVPSAARIETGASDPVDFDEWDVLTIEVNVTAVAGTPSMLVYVQTTYDGESWTDVAVSTVITLVGRYVISTQPPGSDVYARQCFVAGDGTMPTATLARAIALGESVRVKWVITGSTPSLTFSVAGVLRRYS